MSVAGAGAPALVRGAPRRDAPVAVCVPVYQGGEHLRATLESVLAQSWHDVEVVVLDNASTDATPMVLAAIDDDRLVVWRNARTVPMAENFNRVVALSHAPLVKLLPADDLLEPDCLASQVAALQDDTEIAFVVGRSHLVDDRGCVLARSRFLRGLSGTHARDAVVRRVVRSGANPIGGDLAVTFRRAAFTAAGGYHASELHADVDLQLRMLEHGRLHGQDDTVARFRVAPGTVSATASADAVAAQRAWTLGLAAAEPAVRRRDRWIGRVGAPLARMRREVLFGLVRRRAARRSPSTGSRR